MADVGRVEFEAGARGDEYAESPGPCANKCGFHANPGMENLCSKCYREKKRRAAQKLKQVDPFASEKVKQVDRVPNKEVKPVDAAATEDVKSVALAANEEVKAARPANTCAACHKKLHITRTFKCKCELTFCNSHRYPEDHSCQFNFKEKGRQEIAKANPLVRQERVTKI